MSHPTTHVQERPTYTDDYFTVQRAKSDAKVTWEYSRLLAFGGIAMRADMAILDAACGAAPGLRYFTERARSVVGLDISPAALRAARHMLPIAQLVQADLDRSLPFADDTFDLVVLREAIEHVRDGEATLRSCLRILRADGCVALTTPNLWDARRPIYAALRRTWSGDADPTHTHIYSPREMADLLYRAGFAHVHVRTGFKPVARIGGRRIPLTIQVPYPPMIGNGLVAFGWRGGRQ